MKTNTAYELAELLCKAHKEDDEIISKTRYWKVVYKPKSNIILKHWEGDCYAGVAYYDTCSKTAGTFPSFARFEETIINAFWLSKGEIALTETQYIQGYGSLVPVFVRLSSTETINFSQATIIAAEKSKTDERIIHEFTVQQGDEYRFLNKKPIFYYRIRFVHAAHDHEKQKYCHYRREVISPMSITDVLKKIDFSNLTIKYPDGRKEDFTEIFKLRMKEETC